MTSKCIKVQNIDIVNKEMARVQYKFAEEFVPLSHISYVVLAAFTAAYTRLKLYPYLENLQEQVLYFDTNSVIFKYLPGMYCPPVGGYLEALTSELGHNECITTFCSTWPKSYTYTTNKGNNVCKIKGISLNFRNSLTVNLDTLKKIVHDEIKDVKVVYPNMINIVKKDFVVHNVKQEKICRMVYESERLCQILTH